ncbi:MAG: S8 family serine peptidase, partial [Alkalibacterium sp.]|nr:S8 family serine peptidase [Alkalibacterium sp.]
ELFITLILLSCDTILVHVAMKYTLDRLNKKYIEARKIKESDCVSKNIIRKGTKLILLVFLLSFFLPASKLFAEENSDKAASEEYIDIIVRYKETVPDEDLLDPRFKNVTTMDVLPIQTMSVPTSAVRDISLQENVRRITYDQEVETSQSTYPVSSEDWNQDMIGTFDAFEEGYTGKNVNVAILDTGFYQHSEITYSGGHSIFLEDDELGPDPWTNDHSGHGTHVAGIMGAKKGSRTQGIAPGINLYGVKVYHESKGSKTRVGNLLSGLNWAIDNGMDIIVISSGYAHPNNEVHEVIKLAASKGIMTVAASGNMTEENVTTDYPAAHEEVIAVAGVNQKQTHVSDSMIAPENELAAPGQNILSLGINGAHVAMSGTSQAVPHVAGIAALLMEKYPNDSTRTIRQRMIDRSLDLGETGRDLIYGYGLVQYAKQTTDEEPDEPLEETPKEDTEEPKETDDEKETPEDKSDKDSEKNTEEANQDKEDKEKSENMTSDENDDSTDKETADSSKDDSEETKSEDQTTDAESNKNQNKEEESSEETETTDDEADKKSDKGAAQQKTVWIRPSETKGAATVADEDIKGIAENGVLAISFDASLKHIDQVNLSHDQVDILRNKNIILLIARADLEWVIPSSNLLDANAQIVFDKAKKAVAFDSLTKGNPLTFSIEQDGKALTDFPSQMTYRFYTPAAEYNEDALYQWSESEETWSMLGDAYTKGGVVGVTNNTPTLAVFNPKELASAQADLKKKKEDATKNEKESREKNVEEASASVKDSALNFPMLLSSILVVILVVSGGFYFFKRKSK